MALSYCLFFLIAALTVDAKKPLDPQTIIANWKLASHDIESVYATFDYFAYNNVFLEFSYTTGEAYYAAPNVGYWKRNKHLFKRPVPKRRFGSRYYEYERPRAERVIWQDDFVRWVDDEKKTYLEYPQGLLLFGWVDVFSTVSSLAPFLPGLPDKQVTKHFTFEIVHTDDKTIHLKANPNRELKSRWSHCELILGRRSWRLSAVKYVIHEDSEVQLGFKDVTFNPKKRTIDALEGYEKRSVVTSQLPDIGDR